MPRRMFGAGDWFAPKRFGYGAGLPIAWQGWVLVLGYLALLALSGLLNRAGFPGDHALAVALFVLATAYFLIIVFKRTRGGWKWRWGERD